MGVVLISFSLFYFLIIIFYYVESPARCGLLYDNPIDLSITVAVHVDISTLHIVG